MSSLRTMAVVEIDLTSQRLLVDLGEESATCGDENHPT